MSLFNIMALLGAALVATIIYVLNKHSLNKFKYAFISKPMMYISMMSTYFLYGGMYLLSKYNQQIYAWILITIGIVLIGCLIRINCNETNMRYGLIGSIIQIPLLMAISLFALPFLVLYIFGKIIMLFSESKPLPDKTPHQKQQEWYYNRMNPNGFYKRR